MPNSFFQRWLSIGRKMGIQTAVVAVMEAIYVLARYRLSNWLSFRRQYSNSLFLLSLLLLTVSVLYSFGFFGWRRRQQLPALFPARTSRSNEQQLSAASARQDEQATETPRKRDYSLLITSLVLILLAALLSPHSN